MTNNIKLALYSDNAYNELQNKFKQCGFPSDVENFITMFNMKMLSATNPVVKELATAITRTYKNVDLFNNQLIVKNETEIAVENIVYLVEQWKLVSALKRIANELLDLEYDETTRIVFLFDKPGVPFIEQETLEEDGSLQLTYVKVPGVEKVVSKNDEVVKNMIIGRNMSLEKAEIDGNTVEICAIKMEDVIDIDDSFLLEIESLVINKSTKKENNGY